MSFKDYRIGRKVQDTFGTVSAAGDAVRHINCEPISLPAMVNVREHNVADARRHLDQKDVVTDLKELAPEFTITGVVELLEIPFLLYLFFQNVVESDEAAVFDKTFTFPATQGDFVADAGYFATFIVEALTAAKDHAVKDCVCKELKLSAVPGERMKYSATFISRGAVSTTYSNSGTWTRNAGTFFHYSDLDVHTVDTQTFIFSGGWELTLTQDVKPYGMDGSGNFYSYMVDNRRGILDFTLLTNTESYADEADLVAGSYVDIRLGYGNATPGTVVADLDIALHGIFSEANPNTESPAGYQNKLIMVGETDNTEPITVIVADGVDQTW